MNTMRLSPYPILTALALTLGLFPHALAQPTTLTAVGKIAFMRDNAVWLTDIANKNPRRLTGDSVRVNNFLFAPSRKYLAYSEVVDSMESSGIWEPDETPPQDPVLSIVVLDCFTGRIVTRSDSSLMNIRTWLRDDKLLYYESDGFAVGQHFKYDPETDSITEAPDPEYRVLNFDFTYDDSVEAYEGEYGRTLHLFDWNSGRDTVLFSKAGRIGDIRFSHNKSFLAMAEFNDLTYEWLDQLWLYSFKSSSWKLLYRAQSNRKTGRGSGIGWSPDDRYIGIFSPPAAIIVDIHRISQILSIPGEEFSWIGRDKLILRRGDNTYLYDITTHSSTLLLTGASKITVLH